MNDSRWLDDLDAAWDSLVQGTARGDELDPTALQTLDRLHRLQASADAPLNARRRVWVAPKQSRRRFHLRVPQVSAVHAYALVGLLLLVTMAGAFSMSRGNGYSIASVTPIRAVGGQRLYRINGITGAWQAMEPSTLNDIPGDSTPGIEMNSNGDRSLNAIILVSADGSTLVQDVGGQMPSQSDSTDYYVMYDARTMAIKGRVSPGYDTVPKAISADGSRLTLEVLMGSTTHLPVNNELGKLVSYDTRTGLPIASIDLLSSRTDSFINPVVDSTGTKAFVVSAVLSTYSNPSGMAQITEYNLATGAKGGELNVSGVMTVKQWDRATPPPDGAFNFYPPALTISADDQTLALVPSDGHAVVVIETTTFSQRTIPVGAQGNAPCFKANPPLFVAATFSGSRLVLFGWVFEKSRYVGASEALSLSQSGACSLDLKDGSAVFRAADKLLPAGWYGLTSGFLINGDNYYVIGVKNPGAMSRVSADASTPMTAMATYGIFRFDAKTLDLEANKTYEVTDPHAFSGGFLLSLVPPS